MKKIIATVLAMVMALALCTTAFADTVKYTEYKADGTKTEGVKFIITSVDGSYKATNSPDTATKNTVDYYKIVKEGDNTWTGYYVKADKTDYTSKFTADGKADLYLKYVGKVEISVQYAAKATVYTNIGDKCGQIDGSTKSTYYKATWTKDDETVTAYYEKSENGTVNLLVDGELVSVKEQTVALKGHEWKAASYDKDDNAITFKCKNCGTVATVFKTKEAAEASGAATVAKTADEKVTTGAGKWLAYTDGSTTTPSTDNKGNTSPKTFDAGIAMYVGMALTSVAGSAVVIGKKKEF